MDIELAPLLQRTIWGPAILSTAIVFPDIFYSSYSRRILTFAAVAGSVVWSLRAHEIDTPSTSYLFGFAPTWTLIVAAVFLLLTNPPRDFRRIKRKDNNRQGQDEKSGVDEHRANGTISVSTLANGHDDETKNHESKASEYEWEPFPARVEKRFWWTLDLLINFRGLGWNYQKRQHQMPDSVKKVYDESGIKVLRDGCDPDEKKSAESRSAFLLKQARYFVIDYAVLDLMIHFMDRDPWFNRGLKSDERLLLGYPATNFDVLVRPYRVFVGTLATFSVMDLAHVALAIISVSLGPGLMGTHGEPWMHPPLWGDPMELYRRGLPGFWGTFWHDLFRFQFLTITRAVLPGNSTSRPSRIHGFLCMTLIFALSGFMHAAGSYVELRPTSPLWLFAGFVIQSVGVAAQEVFTTWMEKRGFDKGAFGRGLKKGVVLAWWIGWGWLTAPWVIGDMAACGLFQSKVIPFSFVNVFWP